MGGDCLNTGCVPSKALIAAAKRARAMARAGRFGVSAAGRGRFRCGHRHVHDSSRRSSRTIPTERFTGLGVKVLPAWRASAIRRHCGGRGGIEISARRFVVATGSSPALPPIPNLMAAPSHQRDRLRSHAPAEHLIVIGAGPIGLELAQAFRRLGSKVTVLEADQPLAHENPECAASFSTNCCAKISPSAAASRLSGSRAQGRACAWSPAALRARRAIEGSHLLVAAGRRANVDELGLDRAGISYEARACGSTGTCAPPIGASTPLATPPAGHSSPTAPTIMPGS